MNNGLSLQEIVNQKKLFQPKSKIERTEKVGVIYARVSSDGQVNNGDGRDSQIERCIQNAEARKVKIIKHFYDDGISGRNLSREGLDSMLTFIQSKNKNEQTIDYIFMTELSRFSRSENMSHCYKIIDEIYNAGVMIVTREGIIDKSTSIGMLELDFKMMMSKLESRNIGARTADGQKNAIKTGRNMFSPPLGYTRGFIEMDGKSKKIRVPNEYAQIIADGLKMYDSGELPRKVDLIDFLNKHGVKSSAKVQENKRGYLGKQIADTILEPKRILFYAGYNVMDKRGWDMTKGIHKPIISEELASSLITKITGRTNIYEELASRSLPQNDDFPLKGLLFCPHCDNMYRAALSRGKSGSRYPYYFCQNKKCPQQPRLNNLGTKAHQDLDEIFSDIQLNTGMHNLIAKIFEYEYKKKSDELDVFIQEKHRLIKGLELDKEKILDKIMLTSSQDIILRLQQNYDEAQLKISKLEQEVKEYQRNKGECYATIMKKFSEFSKEPKKLRLSSSLDLKKLLLRVRYGNKIYYSKFKGYRTQETPVIKTLLKDFFFRILASIPTRARTWICSLGVSRLIPLNDRNIVFYNSKR